MLCRIPSYKPNSAAPPGAVHCVSFILNSFSCRALNSNNLQQHDLENILHVDKVIHSSTLCTVKTFITTIPHHSCRLLFLLASLGQRRHNMTHFLSHPHLSSPMDLLQDIWFRDRTWETMWCMFKVFLGRQHLLIDLKIKSQQK